MPTSISTFRLPQLGRQKMAELTAKARSLGMTPQRYVRQLIDDDLALDREARTTPLGELAAPFRKALHGASDDEIDGIVSAARVQAVSCRVPAACGDAQSKE